MESGARQPDRGAALRKRSTAAGRRSAAAGARSTAAPDRNPRSPDLRADAHLDRFATLCAQAARRGLKSLSREDAAALPHLYRYAATRLAHFETEGRDPGAVRALRAQLAQGHGLLFEGLEHDPRGIFERIAAFFLGEVPRTIRAEWRPLAASFGIVYGLAIAAYWAVSRDLDLAWSLLDPSAVANEIQQLQSTGAGEPFRGNFTFGLGESPQVAGWIMAHNMFVGVVFFASGLLPPLFALVLGLNGLMIGTYTAVAGHWGRELEISSILWCHGTIEIQVFVLAGGAGLVLVRGLVMPGPWSRAHALRLGARRAWRMMAPVFPLLFCSGLIEGFVSPHADTTTRLAVAVTSGILLLGWVLFCGREPRRVELDP